MLGPSSSNERNISAFGGETLGDTGPNAAACAGDQSPAPLKAAQASVVWVLRHGRTLRCGLVFDLTDRTALVTGAGRGVGLGIARVLIDAGAHVYVNDLEPDRAMTAAAELGERALALPFDVTDLEAVTTSLAAVAPVDVLVNNAGIPPSMRPLPFRQTTPDDWAPFLDINIVGVLNCTRAVIDGMCERGHGRVITISSGSGTHGQNIGVSLYGAGKGGAISFMRHLALETARDGVTANTLAIGLMEREGGPSEITEKMARMIPVGRTGTPDDIGYAVTFLASDEAAWITGQTIAVNGGSTTS